MFSKSHPILLILLLIFWPSVCPAQEKPLDYFIQQGLSNSPLLKDLNNQLRSNAVDSMLVKAQRVPQINFNGQLYYAPVINGYGYSEPITNIGNFSSTINLSQSLFNTKTVNARYMKIGIENQSLANNAKLSEIDLKKSITSQYLTAFSAYADILTGKEILNSLEEQERILKELTRNGIYNQTDYLTFKVELQARRLLLQETEIRYQRELSSLNLLCGITDTIIPVLVLPDLSIKLPVSQSISPYFQRFRFDSLAIRTDKQLLDRSYKPALSWFADAGLVNNDPTIIYKNFGASVGLALSLPVYDGNQRKLNYEKLKNTEDTRQAYSKAFQARYDQQLQQLNRELEMTREMLPQIREELDLAVTVTRLDKDLLNSGEISITDYLLAVRNYISIKQYLNQYEITVLQIINEINYWRQ